MVSQLNKKISRKLKILYVILKFEKEHKFRGHKLKYLFFPENNSNKLMIIFSGFPAIHQSARYNYVTTFKNIKCNKLFILDNFGPTIRGGSYYLGKDRNLFIEDAVNNLVQRLTKKLEVTYKDIVACGTSKGGYAALYFGLKNEYGATIVGAPQTLLGDYLGIEAHQIYLNYIAGGVSESDIGYLNSLLFDAVSFRETKPKIFIHVGLKDHHYEKHVIPFVEHLKINSVAYDLDLKDYDNHSDVGIHFPNYAFKCLNMLGF